MKLSFCCHSAALPLLFIGLVSGVGQTATAQDKSVIQVPKVLVIAREYTKPGKEGSSHEATEGAFAQTMAQFKATDHYVAQVSLTGPPRALFISAYPSFAAWETEHKSMMSNQALSDALDHANMADADLLSRTDQSVWMQRDDLSLNPGIRVGARLEEFSQFRIRPGHMAEWEELVKLVLDGYKKGVPDAYWSTYEEAYGSPGGEFLVVTSLKSASEIDANFASGKKFEEAMGADGMKKLEQLEASCIESRETNLFRIDPKMSYPPDVLVQAEPAFWNVKASTP